METSRSQNWATQPTLVRSNQINGGIGESMHETKEKRWHWSKDKI